MTDTELSSRLVAHLLEFEARHQIRINCLTIRPHDTWPVEVLDYGEEPSSDVADISPSPSRPAFRTD